MSMITIHWEFFCRLYDKKKMAIICAHLHRLTYEQIQVVFIHKFRKSAPARVVIKNLKNEFKWTGSVKVEYCLGTPLITPDAVQNIQAVKHSSKSSAAMWQSERDC